MYAKIFRQIFDSSLAEDYQTRHVFMDLLVLADMDGVVDMTLEAIARRTNIPRDILEPAIRKLCKPDVNSRTETEQGCRLIPVSENRSWGWQIVNFESYHKIRDESARRDYMRLYMRDRRAGKIPCKQSVNTSKHGKPRLAHTDIHKDINLNLKTDELSITPFVRVEKSSQNRVAFVSLCQGCLADAEKDRLGPRPLGIRAWHGSVLESFWSFLDGLGGLSEQDKADKMGSSLDVLNKCCHNRTIRRPLQIWIQDMRVLYPSWQPPASVFKDNP